ncbi:MAG: DUF5060 domain-containing protein [Candidatus Omnitrophica bacterium]|nr:DUF5060 domain-containing protein [Candidatus Omnitrophota bacterium]
MNFEDRINFTEGKRRIKASVRDFGRIAWFWLNKGKWNGKQLLERRFFDEYMKPHVSKDLPHTQSGELDDYLGIGSYGGGSDHFTSFGPGIYGFNWWFNDTGRTHQGTFTWPDAPKDAFMSIGAGGNNTVIIPSLNMVIAAAKADWGKLDAGNLQSRTNQVIKLAVSAIQKKPQKQIKSNDRSYSIQGDLKKWNRVTIDFRGPASDESANDPNPFLDYRLQVKFTSPKGAHYDVPGFFDGDGNGGEGGNIWRIRFSPDEIGGWSFKASFRKGKNVAVSLDPSKGSPTDFNSVQGTFTVLSQDPNAHGFYKFGRLDYVGQHYLKFVDGSFWLKGGNDSPEDLLAYKGFDGTPRARHAYNEHIRDWNPGDPDWNDGAGKGIIGFLNYMGKEHVNSIYFLPNNIGGDGKNVWPYLPEIDGEGNPNNDNLHFDISKLSQWEIVFHHAQQNGVFLHFVLNEAEGPNKRELDDASLGVERKLFYRELIARFGHHPALQWNLCEEYNLNFEISPKQAKEYAGYIQIVDPYKHPVSIHHAGNAIKAWTPFLGDSCFTVTSFQTRDVSVVEEWRKRSKEAGVPHVIGMDEFFPDKATPDNADRHRMQYIWPIYLSGGQLEFILGELLDTENFRSYEKHWKYMWYARKFVEGHLPFWEMEPADELVHVETTVPMVLPDGKILNAKAEAFAKPGAIYAIYLPSGNPGATIDLTGVEGVYSLTWYNPRTGEFEGDAAFIQGGIEARLGSPPRQSSYDWVALLKKR